jgi:mono/diheme cytochrome c family protein
MRLGSVLAVFVASLVVGHAAAAQPELDPSTGLRMTGDWEVVRNNCVACHSARLITQQSGSESHWLGLIRWMQEKQNLWQFDPDIETRIVAYLAENYPPKERSRRAAIPPDLMPPNPYAPPPASDE